MTRALFCSVFVLTVACGSSSSDDSAASKGGNGNSGGSSTGGSHAGTGNSSAGSSSTTGGTGGSTGTAGSGTAGSGTAGTGTAGSGTGGSGGAAPTAGASVTQWGGDIAHTSHWVHASLTKANASKLALDTFTAPAGGADYAGGFAGEVIALPLYLAGQNGAPGEYIAATTQNDVYAFNESTGAVVWKHNIGAYRAAAPECDATEQSHGIIGTPVIDATTRTIYVAGGMSAKNNHELHALNADTGMEVAGGWPVDLASIKANNGTVTMESDVQNQRSALALVGGVVYVAFGGYCGDAGNYHGWVTGVNASDPTKAGAWATMDLQGGIWAPGGLPSDGTGIFAVTGNINDGQGKITDHSKSDTEELIRITGLGVGNRDAKNLFFPTEWVTPMNTKDLDFGSSSPAVVAVPGSTPANVIVAPAKPGRVYFLDSTNLGASLGQFADMAVADTGSQSVYTSPTAYSSSTGVYTAIITGAGSQCAAPVGTNDASVMSILLQPGTPPMPKQAWCAKITTGDGTKRSPISTNSAGNADPIVWTMNGSKLNGFDGDTGAVVFDGGPGTCAGVHRFTSIIVANGHIIAAGDAAGKAHLCSWSVHN